MNREQSYQLAQNLPPLAKSQSWTPDPNFTHPLPMTYENTALQHIQSLRDRHERELEHLEQQMKGLEKAISVKRAKLEAVNEALNVIESPVMGNPITP
jgi:hypothetical protein